jgi:hypothetical protein
MLACPLAIEVPILFGKYEFGIILGISSAMLACPLAIEVPILFSKYELGLFLGISSVMLACPTPLPGEVTQIGTIFDIRHSNTRLLPPFRLSRFAEQVFFFCFPVFPRHYYFDYCFCLICFSALVAFFGL